MYIAAREGVWWTRTITASFAGLFTLEGGGMVDKDNHS